VTGASLIKAAVVAVAAIYVAIIAADPSVFRFLDGVNLVFHEARHVLFGLSGEFVGAWGGTLMQLTIPAAVTVYFVYHRQRYAGAITLFWSAQNLVSISVLHQRRPGQKASAAGRRGRHSRLELYPLPVEFSGAGPGDR